MRIGPNRITASRPLCSAIVWESAAGTGDTKESTPRVKSIARALGRIARKARMKTRFGLLLGLLFIAAQGTTGSQEPVARGTTPG